MISGFSHKVQTGVSLEAEPFHAGNIECNDIKVPTNQFVYVDFGSSCRAEANPGFQFSSWIEDLGNNSTRIISASSPSYSPIGWLTDALRGGTNDITGNLDSHRVWQVCC